MKITYVTRSGSKYSVGDDDALFKNGEPLLEQTGSPVRYVAIKYHDDFVSNMHYDGFPIIANTYLNKFDEIKEVIEKKPHIIGISDRLMKKYDWRYRPGEDRPGETGATFRYIIRKMAGCNKVPHSFYTSQIERFIEEVD